jgi:magnesium transporter
MARDALSRLLRTKRPPPGASPGHITLDPEAAPSTIRTLQYGPLEAAEATEISADAALAAIGKRPVTWIDVEGLGRGAAIAELGKRLDMHRLAVEDVLATHQRCKVDAYDSGLFIVLRAPFADDGVVDTEQISFFLGKNFLATFQEGRPGDCFTGVRDRIRRGVGRIRASGPDYLAYALIDSVVDAYFPVLEQIGERLEHVEKLALAQPTPQTLAAIRRLRRDLLALRRAAWPLREGIHSLLRDHAGRLTPETVLHLRDCYDHAVELLDLVEMFRDLATGLMDVYVSSVNNRMNEVIRVLTIVSTIFIPMSFVAGVYGMNFKRLPEYEWTYGYEYALTIMAALGGGLLTWFWRRGWLRRTAVA